MVYNERYSALKGNEGTLVHTLDAVGMDLRQAWTAYSRRGKDEDRKLWLTLLDRYNKLATEYQKVQTQLELLNEEASSIGL